VRISHADHATTFYHQKLALASPTSGGRSVGIVLSRTKATVIIIIIIIIIIITIIVTFLRHSPLFQMLHWLSEGHGTRAPQRAVQMRIDFEQDKEETF
jgi:hypothetical protein